MILRSHACYLRLLKAFMWRKGIIGPLFAFTEQLHMMLIAEEKQVTKNVIPCVDNVRGSRQKFRIFILSSRAATLWETKCVS